MSACVHAGYLDTPQAQASRAARAHARGLCCMQHARFDHATHANKQGTHQQVPPKTWRGRGEGEGVVGGMLARACTRTSLGGTAHKGVA